VQCQWGTATASARLCQRRERRLGLRRRPCHLPVEHTVSVLVCAGRSRDMLDLGGVDSSKSSTQPCTIGPRGQQATLSTQWFPLCSRPFLQGPPRPQSTAPLNYD
jgi:hypothetical protein